MKIKTLLIVLSAFFIANNCLLAQKVSSSNAVEKMLEEFYTKYSILWNNTSTSTHANVLERKIDSLTQKYCTKKIRSEAKAWSFDGHDLYTNDWGIDLESLKSFLIEKDITKSNTYTVSYIVATYPNSPAIPVKKQIKLHITLIKAKDVYLINEIK